jgi:integrase
MATITKRKDKQGNILPGWKAVIRVKGHPTVCKICDRIEEARDWAKETELEIKNGRYNFKRYKQKSTFSDLVEHYISSGILEHHRSSKDTLRHLKYWKERLGTYFLFHLTPELLAEERQLLLNTSTLKGKKRTASTVNRYVASLSGVLTYGCRQLRWIDENPCSNLIKLKEHKEKRRVLTINEVQRVLDACRKSKNAYLYCIVLFSLTTGARKGEILGLPWDQVDLENKVAHFTETKNGKARSVPLVDAVVQELKIIYKNRNPAKPLVFASKTVFGKIDISKVWKTALKHADIQNFVFHGTRHHFITSAMRSGASNLQVQTAVGHKTLQMLEIYTHLNARDVRHLSETASAQILEHAQ